MQDERQERSVDSIPVPVLVSSSEVLDKMPSLATFISKGQVHLVDHSSHLN